MKIVYWSAFADPFSYLGILHLKQALRQVGHAEHITLEMKSYELDEDEPAVNSETPLERIIRKYKVTELQAQERMDNLSQLFVQIGQPIQYDQIKFCNTHDAHRLAKLATEYGGYPMVDKFTQAVFEAYYIEGQIVSDKVLLTQLAIEAGIPRQAVEELLAGDQYSQAVVADKEEAKAANIFMVPYFALNDNHNIVGATSVDKMVRILENVLAEEGHLNSSN